MPYQATVYRILIASPKDVEKERQAIPEIIYRWNSTHSKHDNIVLLPVMWEKDATPEAGDRTQAIINRQLVDSCDILVGVFWSRIGTHTGVTQSGTIEEIDRFITSGKQVMLYFSSRDLPQNHDQKQFGELKKFKSEIKTRALVKEYKSVEELREILHDDLTRKIRGVHKGKNSKANTTTTVPSGETVKTDSTLLDQEETEILKYLARLENEGSTLADFGVTEMKIAKEVNLSLLQVKYHLENLAKTKYIIARHYASDEQPSEYFLHHKGRKYLIKNKLSKDSPLSKVFWPVD